MAEPTDPPSPGMPPDLLSTLQAATYTDQHYVVAGTPKWLAIQTSGAFVWKLGPQGSGAFSIDTATNSRLLAAQPQIDGSLRDTSGAEWWLKPSGAMAVQAEG